MPDAVYHFSHEAAITRFEPRPAPSTSSPIREGVMVWAVGPVLQQNYLLPRDCPRVCFSALPTSTADDIARLIGPTVAQSIIAVESRWLPIIRSATLYCYELPPETFVSVDEGADYYISREPVVPRTVTRIDDLLDALLERNVELRVTPSLWPLCDAVVASSLRFSCIRMRNARPRESQ
jgi:hypothetical protein